MNRAASLLSQCKLRVGKWIIGGTTLILSVSSSFLPFCSNRRSRIVAPLPVNFQRELRVEKWTMFETTLILSVSSSFIPFCSNRTVTCQFSEGIARGEMDYVSNNSYTLRFVSIYSILLESQIANRRTVTCQFSEGIARWEMDYV